MAAYTSTQSGLWNDSATWGGGGYPDTAGDTVTVNHKVTYNITDSGSAFLGDVTIGNAGNGHLVHQTGTYLNMNGVLNINGGAYEMADDVVLAFTGNNDHDHGIHFSSNDYTTFLARGSTCTAETNMSTSGLVNDTYISVDDASNFSQGDWISVFFRYTDLKSNEDFINEVNYPSGVLQADGELNTGQYSGDVMNANNNRLHNEASRITDEGFIVHDVSSNDIYLRDLIGPEGTVASAGSNYIIVDDADVFRLNQIIIFGTGSNRTASKISKIDYKNNKITLEDNLTSVGVVDEKVYLGGLKIHKHSNSVVRTVGNMVTTEADSGDTTITLSNVGDYSVGDKFYVEHVIRDGGDWDIVMPNNENSWYQDIQIRHEVTGISGNTLTFTPALPYKVYANTFAYKANRRITIKGASDDPSDGTCKPYFYDTQNTSTRTIGGHTRYRRKLIIKDVEFLGIGNSNSNYQFFIRNGSHDGYWRYSKSIEGLVLDGMGNTNNGYGFRADQANYTIVRNLISVNGYRNIYNGREYMSFHNIVFMNGRRGAESVNTQTGFISHIRSTRSYEYERFYLRSYYQESVRQIYSECERYGQWFSTRSIPTQCEFVYRYYLYNFYGGCRPCYLKVTQYADGAYYTKYLKTLNYSPRLGQYIPADYGMVIEELDYKKDKSVMINPNWVEYDKKEKAYLYIGGGGADYNYPIGKFHTTKIEPGETIKFTAQVKIHPDNPNSSWTYRPQLVYYMHGIRQHTSTYYGDNPYLEGVGNDEQSYDFDYVGDPDNLKQNITFPDTNVGSYGSRNFDYSAHPDYYGDSSRDVFTSQTEYISHTISVTNETSQKRLISYGLAFFHANAGYGFYAKPIVAARTSRRSFFERLIDSKSFFTPMVLRVGSVAEKIKNRIGGARL